jgi:hypothetical protein
MGNTIYQRCPDVLVQRALVLVDHATVADALRDPAFQFPEGEPALLVGRRGTIHQFDLVAAFAWDWLDGTRSVAWVADRFVEQFDVDHETACRDLELLLDECHRLGLVSVVGRA